MHSSQRNVNYRNVYGGIEAILAKNPPPTKTIAQGTTVFRFIGPAERKLSYSQLYSLHPQGSTNAKNRWSGPDSTGGPGCSATYWGSASGIASEDYFYTVMNARNVGAERTFKAGPAMILVQGAKKALAYQNGLYVPEQLSFTGNKDFSILVGMVSKNLTVSDLNPYSPQFKEWNRDVSQMLKPELAELRFGYVAQMMMDDDFKKGSQSIANGLAKSKSDPKTIVTMSVRRFEFAQQGYDPPKADVVVHLGADRQDYSDVITGQVALDITHDAANGVAATVRDFAPATALPAASGGPSAAIVSASSEPTSDGTSE